MTPVARKSARLGSSPSRKHTHAERRMNVPLPADTEIRATGKKDQPLRSIAFGSVTIENPVPSRAEIKRNIKAGQAALARAIRAIAKPGVKLDLPEGVPLYHSDPDRLGRLIRVLNGKREHGVFVDGKFRKIAAR